MNFKKMGTCAWILAAMLVGCGGDEQFVEQNGQDAPSGGEPVLVTTVQQVKVAGFSSVGNYCEATFNKNPAVIPNVASINIKIGGQLPTVPDPNYWHINSPTLVMPDASTGIYTEEFVGGVPFKGWHESNTTFHNGPLVTGTWTVALLNLAGTPCSDYDNHVKVTFST
jgi:hypothetical protein